VFFVFFDDFINESSENSLERVREIVSVLVLAGIK